MGSKTIKRAIDNLISALNEEDYESAKELTEFIKQNGSPKDIKIVEELWEKL